MMPPENPQVQPGVIVLMAERRWFRGLGAGFVAKGVTEVYRSASKPKGRELPLPRPSPPFRVDRRGLGVMDRS